MNRSRHTIGVEHGDRGPVASPQEGEIVTAVDVPGAPGVLAELRAARPGEVIDASDGRYEQARRVWNGMIDRRPLAVVRCASNDQVAATIRVAREVGLPLAVRGGGHSAPGFGSCDGGIVLDLEAMRQVRVDAAAGRATAGGGCTWGDYDTRTQESGLASTGGLVSTTGVAGLTLGGGIGWLTRAHGLACDNLLAVELVTAAGEVVRAAADANPDLFWAVRGGGGNFGVVTSFEFELHPVGDLTAAFLIWPYAEATSVAACYRDWVPSLPDELTTMLVFLTGPDMDEIPDALRGEQAIAVLGCHTGSEAQVDHDLEPLRSLSGAVDLSERLGYLDIQQMFDADYPPGRRYYFTDAFFDELSDGLLEALVSAYSERPSAGCEIDIHHMGGAAGRVDPTATAFASRDAPFAMNAYAGWDEPKDDEAHRDWARGVRAACQPFAASEGYVNFAGEVRSADDVRTIYGEARYERLSDIKRRWDPDNLFRLNQNVRP